MHIDGWTLSLQALNLLILLALLRKLFYRPLIAAIDARRKLVDDRMAQAEQLHADAERQARTLADQQAGIDAARQQALQQGRHAIDEERARMLAKAQAAAQSTLEDAHRQIDRERQAVQRALFGEAATLANQMAGRWLGAATDQRDDGRCLDLLLTRLEATSGAARAAWFDQAQGAQARGTQARGTQAQVTQVQVLSARALPDPVRMQAVARLKAAFGISESEIGFVVEPALVSGAELHFPHGVLALSWAAEAAATQARMRDDPTNDEPTNHDSGHDDVMKDHPVPALPGGAP